MSDNNSNMPSGNTSQDPRLHALTTLLHLQHRLRWANVDEVRFIATNETKDLVSYSQAILWECLDKDSLNGKVTSISNTPMVDKNTPFAQYIQKLLKVAEKKFDLFAIQIISKKDFSSDEKITSDWSEWFPEKILWCPLISDQTGLIGGLLLTRSQEWGDGEKNILDKFCESLTFSVNDFKKHKKYNGIQFFKNKKKIKIFFFLMFIAMLFPIRASVLAPAEIIANEPSLIRAPIDGIVKDIPVKPNQRVTAGQVLVHFDKAELEAQLDMAENALKLAQTELRQISQEAMGDSNAMAGVAAAQGRVEMEKTNLTYMKDLATRGVIKASRDGIVVFEDAYDWLGRPVLTGERIMMLADPNDTKLEINLSAQDKIELPDDAKVRFFSNASPHKPLSASVNYVSYRAVKTPDDVMAYRLTADWNENYKTIRLGNKGTAKIYGERRPLIWQILRIPFIKIRQWVGV